MEMFIYEVDGDRTNIYITEFDDVKILPTSAKLKNLI